MNKPAQNKDIREWTDAPLVDAAAVEGYDAQLEQDIAAGLADLDSGKVLSIASMRKEFGLE